MARHEGFKRVTLRVTLPRLNEGGRCEPLTQEIFRISFFVCLFCFFFHLNRNIIFLKFQFIFPILQFGFPFIWTYGHFNLRTISLPLFERPLSSIQFDWFKLYEVSMFQLLFLSLYYTFNVMYSLSCP